MNLENLCACFFEVDRCSKNTENSWKNTTGIRKTTLEYSEPPIRYLSLDFRLPLLPALVPPKLLRLLCKERLDAVYLLFLTEWLFVTQSLIYILEDENWVLKWVTISPNNLQFFVRIGRMLFHFPPLVPKNL